MPKRIYDWESIQAYHDAGHTFVECQKRFDFCHTAWVKAIKRGQLRVKASPFPDRRRRYDWSEVQAYYDEGHSWRQCLAYFRCCSATWTKAVKRGELIPRPRKPLEVILNSKSSRWNKKKRLIRDGLLPNRCQICGITKWLGQPLAIQIDHINGVANDWRLENLRMLCPNCHSQTETFSGRNLKLRRLSSGPISPLILHGGGRFV